jgi:hypothetical protein
LRPSASQAAHNPSSTKPGKPRDEKPAPEASAAAAVQAGSSVKRTPTLAAPLRAPQLAARAVDLSASAAPAVSPTEAADTIRAPSPEPIAATQLVSSGESAVAIAKVYRPIATQGRSSTPSPSSPLQAVSLVAALAATRDELGRRTLAVSANLVAAQATSLAVDSTPKVLVIGVDGTNIARVLADPNNVNFSALILGSTTGVSSIAGHTTISDPSWTAILTGMWGETTGVINNIYNPAVYNRYPTVFTQLEMLNPAIHTTAIANWDVIAAIAASGTVGADEVHYISQISGDSDWSQTDDAVGAATEAAIAAADPTVGNLIFSYFVGVDENGHLHGGASPQYAGAVENIDQNIGEIMAAVNAWEAATGEQWTVIVVTDHGHQPQQGFGHGFQTPAETTTFVIANNPDIFTTTAVNPAYSIVDVTPTVVTLFGGTPRPHSDGVSLTTLGASTVVLNDENALRAALEQEIDSIDFPDVVTNLALSVRTIFASVPYFVVQITDSVTASLRKIADENRAAVGPLAQVMIVPVQFAGDALYVVTNIVAQVVARLTGVTGASIFPLLPPSLPPLSASAEKVTAAALCTATVATACV